MAGTTAMTKRKDIRAKRKWFFQFSRVDFGSSERLTMTKVTADAPRQTKVVWRRMRSGSARNIRPSKARLKLRFSQADQSYLKAFSLSGQNHLAALYGPKK